MQVVKLLPLAHGGPLRVKQRNSMDNEKKRGRPAGKSRCECSVIGYLVPDVLEMHLSALVQSGTIGHYWFVEHEPDEDVSKPHCHVRLCPPASRAVDWSAICERVQQTVPGEDKPRRLVLYKGSVNDAWQDALLYARHDSRYLAAKGLVKATVDIPTVRFHTDSREWLEQIWTASDSFEPEPRRLSKQDVMEMVDNAPDLTNRQLLRIVMVNNMTMGDYQLFITYRSEVRRELREMGD